MKATLVFRVRILCGLFVFGALIIGIRLYFVQIVHGEGYVQKAQQQYVAESSGEMERGEIIGTSRDGTPFLAAVMQTGWLLAIEPNQMDSPEDALERILPIVPDIDRDAFLAAAAQKNDPWEEIMHRIPEASAKAISALRLSGVKIAQEKWRYYPGGPLAAHVLGFVGYRGDVKEGVYGLERSWQGTLAHESDGLNVNPFAEIFTNVRTAFSLDPAREEGSIVTSIEPSVQAQLEKTLEGVMETYTPEISGGIVMDPKTGEIVAMALRPTFDPNTFNTEKDPAVFSNLLVEGRYEMGSIMKPLTMAIGIDAGAITPETTYNDTGCFERSGKTICNHDKKARHKTLMQEILSQSLNLGATFVAEETGAPTFTRYMKALGLEEKTGIDLPNEISGDLSPLGDGTGPVVNYATASFGQGVSVTPIEMTRALSALANGGRLPHPHLVTHIRFESGITRAVEEKVRPEVFSPETAEAVTRMLVTVFDDALLKGTIKEDRYSIAAKTGTAQLVSPDGGYYSDRFLHSFFGYFPAHDARFIIFLFAVDPQGATFASATLAHPFSDMARFLIHYYRIPPDR
jgi:cell division protein FtsI/penicillin-binding protein 2